MNIIILHPRSSYKHWPCPKPHIFTIISTQEEQPPNIVTREQRNSDVAGLFAGPMLYCLIISCNFMLNYLRHEGRFPFLQLHCLGQATPCANLSTAALTRTLMMLRFTELSTFVCKGQRMLAWRRASLGLLRKGFCGDSAFTASAEAPWSGVAKGTWTANPKVHCDNAPPPLSSRGAHTRPCSCLGISTFRSVKLFIFQAASVRSSLM